MTDEDLHLPRRQVFYYRSFLSLVGQAGKNMKTS